MCFAVAAKARLKRTRLQHKKKGKGFKKKKPQGVNKGSWIPLGLGSGGGKRVEL